MVKIENLCKAFDSQKVLDDISFTIKAGEFFSLLGPSGCGKTTLLRLLGGFEAASSGHLLIDGQPVHNLPPEKRPTNTVFQSYALFPHLTVAQNIAYGLRSLKLPKDEQQRCTSELLEMIRLAPLARRKPHELSGGQRQRVALARALARKPKVLLLDEPLSALDKQLREEMQVELRRIQRQVGITFVFVTHDQEEALALSDRMAVMSRGRILQIDTPSRIYEFPANRSVASFIGSINLFSGQIGQQQGHLAHVHCAGLGVFAVNIENTPCPPPGSAVILAVRPEKMRLAASDDSQLNRIEGKLLSRAYYGDRMHLRLLAKNGSKLLLCTANDNRAAADGLDRPLIVTFAPQSAIVLPETEVLPETAAAMPD